MEYIQDNLILKDKGLGKDECYLMIKIIMKVIGRMICLMEKEDMFIMRMNIMKEISEKENNEEKGKV